MDTIYCIEYIELLHLVLIQDFVCIYVESSHVLTVQKVLESFGMSGIYEYLSTIQSQFKFNN